MIKLIISLIVFLGTISLLAALAVSGIADDKIERITGKDINKNDKQSNQ